MRRHLPAAVMAALILTAGTIHGRWTNRWARATELQHAIDHIGKLPLAIGDWEGRDNVLDEKEQKRARLFLSEELFRRLRKRCRFAELPLPAILPGVERLAIPLASPRL